MERIDDVELNDIGREDREQEEITIEDSSFSDFNYGPGTISFDILGGKFGMHHADIRSATLNMPDFKTYKKEDFPKLLEKNKTIQQFVLKKVFEDSGFRSDFSLIDPLLEQTEFSITEKGRVKAKVGNRAFFFMDKNGRIEFLKKDGTLYTNDVPGKTKMSVALLKSLGYDKRDVSNILTDVTVNRGKNIVGIAKLYSEETKDDIENNDEEIDDLLSKLEEDNVKDDGDIVITKDDYDNKQDVDGAQPGTSSNDQQQEREPNKVYKFVIEKQQEIRQNIAKLLKKLKKTKKEDYIGNPYRTALIELDKEIYNLETTLPLKTKINYIMKIYGLTVGSVILAVSAVVTSIATSLMNSAAVTSASASANKEIQKLKEENKKLKREGEEGKRDTDEKIKKNEEEIDKLKNKKSIWDYIKQAAAFILSSASALAGLIGKLISYFGKAMVGLGWIVYVVIVTLAALAYGYYEK